MSSPTSLESPATKILNEIVLQAARISAFRVKIKHAEDTAANFAYLKPAEQNSLKTELNDAYKQLRVICKDKSQIPPVVMQSASRLFYLYGICVYANTSGILPVGSRI